MYNPRIYIRDYGSPTRRMLAFSGSYLFHWFNADFRRDLIMHAENPATGEEFMLLAGDMQAGSDVIDLSGSGNDLLVLTNDTAIRFFGSDVALQYSNISGFPSWSYDLVGNDAELRRTLFFPVTVDTFALTYGSANLLRGVLMAADTGTYAMTASAATFTVGNILVAEPAAYALTVSDAELLRQLPMTAASASFAWSGVDVLLTRTLFMPATVSTFAFTFNDASASTDSIIALSGDASSGGDLLLVSGDAQTGTDYLLISQ